MSYTLKNLTIFRKFLTAYNFHNTQCFLSSSKGTLSKSIYSDLDDNTSEIFDYIHKNQDSLSGQNYIEALRKFSQCYPESSHRSKQFKDKEDLLLMICIVLCKRIKTLNLSQAETVQLLTELGISPKSIITQFLLTNIETNSYSPTAKEAGDLNKIRGNFRKKDLTNTTKIPSSEILQLKQDKTDSRITSLGRSLYLAVKEAGIENRSAICTILHEISKYSNANISAINAKNIFISSAEVPEIVIPEFTHLLRRLQDIIIEYPSFNYQNLRVILCWMASVVEKTNYGEEFYNEQLINTTINKLLSHDQKMIDRINVLIALRSLRHFHKPFLDFLVCKILEDPMLVSKFKTYQLSTFLSGLSLFDYKPLLWELIEHLIVDNVESQVFSAEDLILSASNLAIMGSFSNTLISRVFQLPQTVLRKEIRLSTFNRFILLYQLVKTFYPNYAGPWPSEDVFHNMCLEKRNKDYLLPALEKALGGSEYIITNVKTKLHHLINCVIVMREGGFPVAINQRRGEDDSNYEKKYTQFVEDIIVPPGSQVILIITLSNMPNLRNSNKLRGGLRAMEQTLEALKYAVIFISLTEWKNLSERHKILFIMSKIRLKCSTDSATVNV